MDPRDLGQGIGAEEKSLERSRGLHWVHWVVVILSLVLTVFAWFFSKSQIELKVRADFDRQVAQLLSLVEERMQKYEDGLWGGVSAIGMHSGPVSSKDWKKFALNLNIDTKYPGINGIGVIFNVPRRDFKSFLKMHRRSTPEFKVFPTHQESLFLPITYIEPLEMNKAARGLDMAHEKNRYVAAKQARDTGLARITGPIVLVQDSGKTPGFLFYAPFYKTALAHLASEEERQRQFLGLVYAPFVVKKLMEGTLSNESRQVDFRITDDGKAIYDELSPKHSDFDPNPIFKTSMDLSLYGRVWTFEIWSAKSFRAASSSNQPYIILICGLLIDSLLLLIFYILSQSRGRALDYAGRVTKKLKAQTQELEKSNIELEQFAYVASHDLQAPVRHILAYSDFLKEEIVEGQSKETKTALEYTGVISKSAEKMKALIQDLLTFSGIGNQKLRIEKIYLSDFFKEIQGGLSGLIKKKTLQWNFVMKASGC